MTDFNSFDLAEPVARALTAAGYADPTPIQKQAIPLAMAGKDLLGIAQTGTGKTLAFAAPTLHKLCKDQKAAPPKGCRVLVLAPTRELAAQIAESFQTYAQFMGLRVITAFGGVKITKQKRQLERGAHVLVATPGRLEDLENQRALRLDAVDTLILDEADQMMDLGFIHALRRIVKLLPVERQTLFFSATMPKAIADLSKSFLTDPSTVSVTPQATTAERVNQSAYFITQKDKPALLSKVLKDPAVKQALVFTRTKHGADKVVRQLAKADIDAVAIHGNKSQPQRRKALDAFKGGKVWVMVATDIAARGLDISGLSHVVNYELPNVPEQYVHRIGRTGRAGAEGIAISLVAGDEKGYLRDIEKITKQSVEILVPREGFEDDETDRAPAEPQRGRGQGGGQGRRQGGGQGSGQARGQGRRPKRGAGGDDKRNKDRGSKPASQTASGGRQGGSGSGQGGPKGGGGTSGRRRGRPNRAPVTA
ncbi:MAG: DEAD/DEAH box helicase [Pseudomonadota bacterium]